jgi:hypothetical protein
MSLLIWYSRRVRRLDHDESVPAVLPRTFKQAARAAARGITTISSWLRPPAPCPSNRYGDDAEGERRLSSLARTRRNSCSTIDAPMMATLLRVEFISWNRRLPSRPPARRDINMIPTSVAVLVTSNNVWCRQRRVREATSRPGIVRRSPSIQLTAFRELFLIAVCVALLASPHASASPAQTNHITGRISRSAPHRCPNRSRT